MARLQLCLRLLIIICFIFIVCVNCARDQKPNQTISKHHREKKSHLVKKYLRRLKKQEGLLKLVDGRGEYEGRLIETSPHYTSLKSAPSVGHYVLM
jgi:lysyl oxidase-like protein 2/3/4